MLGVLLGDMMATTANERFADVIGRMWSHCNNHGNSKSRST